MFRLFRPHLRVQSVVELTLDRLGEMGLDALLLDVDCTLKGYRDDEVAPEVAAWLDRLRTGRIALCLVSNGRGKRIGRLAEKLDLPSVTTALKPLPLGCRAGLRKLGVPASRAAMVGDQLFADVPAGRLAGLTTVLVRPIRPEEEPWPTRLKRPFERFLLRRMGLE